MIGAAGHQHDQISDPESDGNEPGIHQHVVREKDRSPPGGKVAHQRVGQGSGTKSSRRERVLDQADQKSCHGAGAGTAPHSQQHEPDEQKVADSPGHSQPGTEIELQSKKNSMTSSSWIRVTRGALMGGVLESGPHHGGSPPSIGEARTRESRLALLARAAWARESARRTRARES